MDLFKLIQELKAEKERLERVIASLEELEHASVLNISAPPDERKRRGRRSMGAEERQEVSARMKKYWASRR
jgi:hypothetical protein